MGMAIPWTEAWKAASRRPWWTRQCFLLRPLEGQGFVLFSPNMGYFWICVWWSCHTSPSRLKSLGYLPRINDSDSFSVGGVSFPRLDTKRLSWWNSCPEFAVYAFLNFGVSGFDGIWWHTSSGDKPIVTRNLYSVSFILCCWSLLLLKGRPGSLNSVLSENSTFNHLND